MLNPQRFLQEGRNCLGFQNKKLLTVFDKIQEEWKKKKDLELKKKNGEEVPDEEENKEEGAPATIEEKIAKEMNISLPCIQRISKIGLFEGEFTKNDPIPEPEAPKPVVEAPKPVEKQPAAENPEDGEEKPEEEAAEAAPAEPAPQSSEEAKPAEDAKPKPEEIPVFPENGIKHGWAREISPDGTVFLGQYSENQKNGKGATIYGFGIEKKKVAAEGDEGGDAEKKEEKKEEPICFYCGDWKNDKRNGKGFLKEADSKYCGDFADDKKQGKGVLTTVAGEYAGMFGNDMKHGHGIFKFFADKSYYEGQWENNQIKTGKWVTQNGLVFEGNFANTKPVGQHTVTRGSIKKQGVWKDDVFQIME